MESLAFRKSGMYSQSLKLFLDMKTFPSRAKIPIHKKSNFENNSIRT